MRADSLVPILSGLDFGRRRRQHARRDRRDRRDRRGVLVAMGLTVWAVKVAWEIAAMPLSLPLIAWLKRREGVDRFDRDADFSPLRLGRR